MSDGRERAWRARRRWVLIWTIYGAVFGGTVDVWLLANKETGAFSHLAGYPTLIAVCLGLGVGLLADTLWPRSVPPAAEPRRLQSSSLSVYAWMWILLPVISVLLVILAPAFHSAH